MMLAIGSENAGGFLAVEAPGRSENRGHVRGDLVLPTQRARPLRAGGAKEADLVSYIENRLLTISGRYERRFDPESTSAVSAYDERPTARESAYTSFDEIAHDLIVLTDVIWVSNTIPIQLPFLLNIANAINTYISTFSFAPQSTFLLLKKLDLTFGSLVHGVNLESGELLQGRKMTITEKVRLKGIAERTRVEVVIVAGHSRVGESAGDLYETTDTTDVEAESPRKSRGGLADSWEMAIAGIYARVLEELGASLIDMSFGSG